MILNKLKKILYTPSTPVTKKLSKLQYLGTDYGGWYYKESDYLYNSVLVSGGAGEDISFEIEFVKKYNAKVIIIDPTPRSIEHVSSIQKRIGVNIESTASYSNGGNQPVNSYDLSGIDLDQITFLPVALWNKNEDVAFFEPKNSEHVSHSIVNLQKTNNFMKVKGVTLDRLIEQYELSNITILKLDIEGAEIEVIDYMLSNSIKPDQILVEFDEINFPSMKSKKRVERIYRLLINNRYDLINISKGSDYCFVKNES